MQCDEYQDLLEEFVDGELDSEANEAVASHLAGCAECSIEVDMLRRELELYARYDRSIEVRPELWAGIESRIAAERDNASPSATVLPFRRLLGHPQRNVVVAAIAASLLVAALAAAPGVLRELRETAPQQVANPPAVPSPAPEPPQAKEPTDPIVKTAPGDNETGAVPTNVGYRPKSKSARHARRGEEPRTAPLLAVESAEREYKRAIDVLSRDSAQTRRSLTPELRDQSPTVVHDHPRAALGQLERMTTAHSATGAGHHDDVAVEAQSAHARTLRRHGTECHGRQRASIRAAPADRGLPIVPPVPMVVEVTDDEWEHDSHVGHRGVVGPHGSEVRAGERSSLVRVHDRECIEVDQGAGEVCLAQALGDRLCEGGLTGARRPVKDKNLGAHVAYATFAVGPVGIERLSGSPRIRHSAPEEEKRADTTAVPGGGRRRRWIGKDWSRVGSEIHRAKDAVDRVDRAVRGADVEAEEPQVGVPSVGVSVDEAEEPYADGAPVGHGELTAEQHLERS